ncbi:MAG: LD-carboxypeptidase, partial [Patescibacteria group bacterium]
MVRPVALRTGDTVGVIAPSDAVEKKSLEKSAEIVRRWGLKLKFGKHIYSKVGDFSAGTADERIEDLKTM